jgi:hypothetical protein
MTSNSDIAYIQHTAGPEGINKTVMEKFQQIVIQD